MNSNENVLLEPAVALWSLLKLPSANAYPGFCEIKLMLNFNHECSKAVRSRSIECAEIAPVALSPPTQLPQKSGRRRSGWNTGWSGFSEARGAGNVWGSVCAGTATQQREHSLPSPPHSVFYSLKPVIGGEGLGVRGFHAPFAPSPPKIWGTSKRLEHLLVRIFGGEGSRKCWGKSIDHEQE